MDESSLSRSTWDCKWPRSTGPSGYMESCVVNLFSRLALQKGCRIEEGHLMPDHMHMLISIPPKYSVAHIVGS